MDFGTSTGIVERICDDDIGEDAFIKEYLKNYFGGHMFVN